MRGGQSVKTGSADAAADLERSTRRVAVLLRRGVRFTPTQQDIIRIEKMMIAGLNNGK